MRGMNFDARDFLPRKFGNEVKTTADGRFEFRGRDYRRQGFAVVAMADHNAPAIAVRNQAPVGDGVDVGDLLLREGSTLAGLVVEDTGGAVAEATITLRNDERGGGQGGMFRGGGIDRTALLDVILPPVRTTVSGTFEIRNLPEGSYRVAARADRMLPGETESIKVPPGQRADAGTLKLTRGVELRGIVLDPASAPVAAADVFVNPGGGGGGGPPWMRLDENLRAKTDKDGRFELRGLPKTPITVRARKEGLRDNQLDNVTAGTGDVVTVQLKAPLAIAGVVVDAASGEPVLLYAARARRIWTNEDAGGVNIRNGGGANPGDVQTRRRGPGGNQAGQAGQAGQEARQGQDAARQRREAAAEQIANRGGGRRGNRGNQPGPTGKPDKHPEGRFLLTDLDPGTYAVDISSPDHMSAASTEVRVVEGQPEPPVVRVALSRGSTIAGVCVDLASGEPLAGAEMGLVWVDPEDGAGAGSQQGGGNQGGGGRGNRGDRLGQLFQMATGFGGRPSAAMATVKADGQGRFQFAHQRPGRYLVQGAAADHAPGKTTAFDVAEAKDLTTLRVTLARGATVTGRVLGLRTKESSAAIVSSAGPMRREVPTQLDGTYVLANLEPGEYLFRARRAESDNMLQMRDLLRMLNSPGGRDTNITLQEGQTLNLDLELIESHMALVEGSVLRNGTPAAGHDVSLRPLDLNLGNNNNNNGGEQGGGGPGGGFGGPEGIAGMAGGMLRGSVGTDGRFRIESVPEGRYQVEVRRGGGGGGGRGGPGGRFGGGGTRVYRRDVTVTRGQPLDIAITFAVGELQGSVAAAEGTAQMGRVRAFLVPAEEARGKNVADLNQGGNSINVQIDKDQLTARDLPAGDYVLVVTGQGRKRTTQNVLVPAAGPVRVQVLLEKEAQAAPGEGSAPAEGAQPGQPGGRQRGGGRGPGGGPGRGGNGGNGPGNGNAPGNGGTAPTRGGD
jgi:hypothetical protein